MQDDADKAIRHHFNSRSRKVAKLGKQYLVPLKYDEAGNVLTQETFDIRDHLKRLNLNDWRFLESWRRHDWNVAKATEELGLTDEQVKRLVRKMQVFQDEEARDKALATIPTPAWIQAKHVENVYDGKLDDSKRDSLKELAKIQGAYKSTTNINVNHNVIQLSVMTPDEQKRLKEIGDHWQEGELVNG